MNKGATNLLRQAMSEVTHGEKSALATEPTFFTKIGDVVKLDSLNRESYI